ncbi:uncharacterized protein ACRADG_002076 [Cochliomyia hominivorax]
MFFRIFIISLTIWHDWKFILASENPPPNIIIIIADDMGIDDVSFRGASDYLTPNIDALAYQGKILNRLYTPPICTPSRATLLTGLYPIHTGTQHFVLSNEDPWGILENITSMAEIFQSQGYSTHLVGKWHLGMARKEFTPIFKGFDSHYGYWGGYIDYFRMTAKMPTNYSMGYDFRRNLDLECAPPDSYVTDLFTQEAEKIILNNKFPKPLFLMVTHLAMHTANEDEPLQAPEQEIEKFTYIPDIRRRTYAAMASKLDESVGRIIKALDQIQQLKNSIILFYSDNGGPSAGLFNNTGRNWPLRGQKHSPWEGGIRVPAAIWSPLLKNRNSIHQLPLYLADWLPTLAAAAKIPLNSFKLNLDGLNQWPDLVNSKTDTLTSRHKDREIPHMLDHILQVKSFMKGDYKYIQGTTIEGQYDHVLLHRNPSVSDPRNRDYVRYIQNSLAYQALDKFNEKPLSPHKIQNLRSQAEIKCGKLGPDCDPLKEECLFNIWLDPCEQNNLAKASQYQEKLRELRERVRKLEKSAVRPLYGGSFIDNDPSRHDCIWTNFLEESIQQMYKILIILCIMVGIKANVLGKDNKRPNIVIIMADDMGFDDVSFRGAREFLTPNIDALAYHGKILNRLYTPPMCTPSRASLLTGLYPIHTGTQHYVIVNEEPWGILENFTSMAEIFQSQGYATHLVGKWHLGLARKEFTPLYNGFDSHYGYWGAYVDYFRMRSKMPTNYSMGYDFRRNLDLECVPEGRYVTDLFTQEAENIILNSKSSEPLFLMVSHLAMHTANDDEPLQAPEKEIEKFSYIPDVRRRTYAAMASKLDESVGRIIKALDKAQKLKNSIILFYSDNGAPSAGLFNNTGSNWPFRGQKNSPWEGGIRVPAAIWSPLIKNRNSIHQLPLYVGDWLPTLAAAAKIPLNSRQLNLDGLNQWTDLVNSKGDTLLSPSKEREIVHFLDDIYQVKSFMKGQYKYIQGTTIQGNYDHVLINRNPNITDPRDREYVQTIQNSLAHQALNKFAEKPLTALKIQNLRSQAEIKCGKLGPDCDPLKEECLFNIWLDPCEQNNLAKQPQYQKKLRELKNRAEELRLTALSPRIGGSVIDNDPSRHDCTWTNYLEVPVTNYILECDYNSPPCRTEL